MHKILHPICRAIDQPETFSGSLNMKPSLIALALAALSGCMYAETPDGRFAAIDVALPTHSTTTVHKTVTVNAPPGTVVNISETPPPTVIYRDYPRRECYYDRRIRRKVCVQ